MIQDPHAPLLSELRWFVMQRWLAGTAMVAGSLLSTLWFEWSNSTSIISIIGVSILGYNIAFYTLFTKSPRWLQFQQAQRTIAWAQITLDLACLTVLTTITNGIYSPAIGLFVLHMIFASLLLQTPKLSPYISWLLAIIMMATALRLTDQWPSTQTDGLVAIGWLGTLLLTIFFTTHITNNVRTNHERTRAVLDAAADGVLTIDHFGLIELANPTATEMFGYTSAQMVGQRIDRIVSDSDLQGLTFNHAHSQSSPTSATQANDSPGFGLRKDGSKFPIEVSMSKLNEGSQKTTTMIIRDISERERNEAQLKKLNQELEQQQSQLIQNERMAAVGRMAAGVAHEIANPLANIDGMVQLIERNPSRMNSTETPAQLREQVARITHIVRLLKDFAHPLEFERQTISVDQLIQSATDMIRFDRRHQQVSIQNRLINPCCNVHVNPHTMQQVLVNLIVNALDAVAHEDSHQVTISSICTDDGECRITIQDNGTGIPAADMDQIFEPFFTTKPMGKGTGLGLSISYNLIQHNEGRIEITSEVNIGTSVTVILPVADCSC